LPPAGVGRVTTYIDHNNPQNEAFFAQNPNFSLPYARFLYDISGSAGSTGSAVFVSESLWMAGMPMTKNSDFDGNCEPLYANPNETTPRVGWRFCTDKKNTVIWEYHTALAAYFTDTSPRTVPEAGSNALVNSVLSKTNKGVAQGGSKAVGAISVAQVSIKVSEIGKYMRGVTSGIIKDQEGLVLLFDAKLQNIRAGDYLWLDSGRFPHGLVVIGWGVIQNCDKAITTIFNTEHFELERKSSNTVPYVADFLGSNNDGMIQRPVARPFYCTRYAPNDQGFFAHDWYFFTLKDQIIFTEPNQPQQTLYTPQNWQWNSGE
jgi:hypothetical protein